MTADKGFEKIISWKKARELNKEIYRLTTATEFSKDFALRDQIRRASIPISSNIAEGFGKKNQPGIHLLPKCCSGLML